MTIRSQAEALSGAGYRPSSSRSISIGQVGCRRMNLTSLRLTLSVISCLSTEHFGGNAQYSLTNDLRSRGPRRLFYQSKLRKLIRSIQPRLLPGALAEPCESIMQSVRTASFMMLVRFQERVFLTI